MIAELAITLFLVCSSPAVLRAEMDGLVNHYTVQAWRRAEDGHLVFRFRSSPEDMNFYNQVAKEMQRQGKSVQYVNKNINCS